MSNEELIAKAKTWRAQLAAVGGWENELVSVPAGGVRAIIENAEQLAAALEAAEDRIEDLEQPA